MYHLRAVMRDGYVQKVSNGYQLTSSGKQYVDKISMEKFQPRIQPKIVTLLVIKNSKGELLLWKRDKQPFIGKIGFITGKIHLGENIADAANRELQEKAGLTARTKHIGDGYLTIYEEKELVSQVLFHCFTGICKTDEIPKELAKNVFWGGIKNYKSELIPGMPEIYKLSQQDTHFFAEITKNIHSG